MHPLFLDGSPVASPDVPPLTRHNPATLAPLGEIAGCGPAQIAQALAGALRAQPAWAAMSDARRAAALAEVAASWRQGARAIARLAAAEGGMPVVEAHDAILAGAACLVAPVHALRPRGEAPLAVALLPASRAALGFGALAGAALDAGVAIIVVAPPSAAQCCLSLAAGCAGLPPGLVQVLVGDAATGRAVATLATQATILGTGVELAALWAEPGTEAAQRARLQAVDAAGVPPGPAIVCADADLERAVPALAWHLMTDAGQVPGASRRIYVDARVAADCVARLHGYLGLLDVGDPGRPATDVGPLRSAGARERVEAGTLALLREGARLVLGGRPFSPSGLRGHFFQPTLLTDVALDSPAAAGAPPGPLVLVTPVDGPAAALRALATVAGAGLRRAALYTGNLTVARDLLEAAAPGEYRINDPAPAGDLPFELPGAGAGAGAGVAPSTVTDKPWWFPYERRRCP